MAPIPPDPEPAPIHFDQRLAQEAIDALLAAARLLQQHTTTDLGNAAKALDGWEGHHAATFRGGDLPWIRSESTRIIDGMLKLAGTIVQSAATAHTLAQQAQRRDPPALGGPRPR